MKIIFGVLIYEALGVMWWLIFTKRRNISIIQNFYEILKILFAIGFGNPENIQALPEAIEMGYVSEERMENVMFILGLIDVLILWPINLFIITPVIWIYCKFKK